VPSTPPLQSDRRLGRCKLPFAPAAVSLIRFCNVTAEHAMAEGEGDGSLDFWRTIH
jgi:uncharacterized protein YhfF